MGSTALRLRCFLGAVVAVASVTMAASRWLNAPAPPAAPLSDYPAWQTPLDWSGTWVELDDAQDKAPPSDFDTRAASISDVVIDRVRSAQITDRDLYSLEADLRAMISALATGDAGRLFEHRVTEQNLPFDRQRAALRYIDAARAAADPASAPVSIQDVDGLTDKEVHGLVWREVERSGLSMSSVCLDDIEVGTGKEFIIGSPEWPLPAVWSAPTLFSERSAQEASREEPERICVRIRFATDDREQCLVRWEYQFDAAADRWVFVSTCLGKYTYNPWPRGSGF